MENSWKRGTWISIIIITVLVCAALSYGISKECYKRGFEKGKVVATGTLAKAERNVVYDAAVVMATIPIGEGGQPKYVSLEDVPNAAKIQQGKKFYLDYNGYPREILKENSK